VSNGRKKIVIYDIENNKWLDDEVVEISNGYNNENDRYDFSVVTFPGSSRD
jgi:hypothetical protein